MQRSDLQKKSKLSGVAFEKRRQNILRLMKKDYFFLLHNARVLCLLALMSHAFKLLVLALLFSVASSGATKALGLKGEIQCTSFRLDTGTEEEKWTYDFRFASDERHWRLWYKQTDGPPQEPEQELFYDGADTFFLSKHAAGAKHLHKISGESAEVGRIRSGSEFASGSWPNMILWLALLAGEQALKEQWLKPVESAFSGEVALPSNEFELIDGKPILKSVTFYRKEAAGTNRSSAYVVNQVQNLDGRLVPTEAKLTLYRRLPEKGERKTVELKVTMARDNKLLPLEYPTPQSQIPVSDQRFTMTPDQKTTFVEGNAGGILYRTPGARFLPRQEPNLLAIVTAQSAKVETIVAPEQSKFGGTKIFAIGLLVLLGPLLFYAFRSLTRNRQQKQ